MNTPEKGLSPYDRTVQRFRHGEGMPATVGSRELDHSPGLAPRSLPNWSIRPVGDAYPSTRPSKRRRRFPVHARWRSNAPHYPAEIELYQRHGHPTHGRHHRAWAVSGWSNAASQISMSSKSAAWGICCGAAGRDGSCFLKRLAIRDKCRSRRLNRNK